jgi:hypothetical protein
VRRMQALTPFSGMPAQRRGTTARAELSSSSTAGRADEASGRCRQACKPLNGCAKFDLAGV